MKYALLITGIFFLFSCGPMVSVDFEKQQDFSDFRNFDFYPDIDSGLSELDDKRIMRSIDSVLRLQGISRAADPRFYINFYASEHLSNSRNTLGIGVGGGGGNVGVGVSGGIPIGGPVIRQQFTIDFVNATGDQSLVWQAVVDAEYKERASPTQKDQYYYSIIRKALGKFPPKK
ncbi:MAG: DUF4136 domain-containing protein [Flavobacteriaceae bacterium]|nr:DUF4136 domain-containing protein [Flavobacteriaceae bacterium]